MADNQELTQQAQQRIDLAEGYMADAEFREEHETRLIRYLQAAANIQLALYAQNKVIIDLMTKQQEAMGGRR
jgi:hypothetical protein